MKLDVVITGVGGQGTVLTSRVIAQTAMQTGYEVRTAETIGMAQREGSVISNVRVGKNLAGALVPDNKADILLSFELAETVKGLSRLKPGGVIIANTGKVVPVSVPLGISTYDEEKITAALYQKTDKVLLLDAAQAAIQVGNPKVTNTVLLGVFSTLKDLPFKPEDLLEVILQVLPTKVRDVNQKAFELGQQLVEVKQYGLA